MYSLGSSNLLQDLQVYRCRLVGKQGGIVGADPTGWYCTITGAQTGEHRRLFTSGDKPENLSCAVKDRIC